jgi:hypothetical protein
LILDEFQVTGPPEGMMLSFFAELRVEGTIEGGGEIWAGLAGGGTSEYEVWRSGPVNETIKLSLQYPPEEPFLLMSEMGVLGKGMEGVVGGVAILRFSGLPPGSRVTSCQKYNVPVQVQQHTWGQLKSLYR